MAGLIIPATLSLFFPSLFNGKKLPNLIIPIILLPLDDTVTIIGDITSFDIQPLPAKSVDVICLIGMLSLGDTLNAEPTAVVLATISDHISPIITLVKVDTKSGVGGLDDKGVFVALGADGKMLGVVFCVGVDGEFVVGDGQGFRWVQN